MNEDNTKVLRTIKHTIAPFRTIRIGDPSYFEEMANDSKNKRLKDLTCNIKTTCCKVGSLKIDEIEETMTFNEKPYTVKYYNVSVLLASTPEQLEVYESGLWYGEQSLKKQYTLGCDTACYEIIVDGRYEKIYTGADGYYGTLKHLKQYYGLMLDLSFDASLFDLDELETKLNHLFKYLD